MYVRSETLFGGVEITKILERTKTKVPTRMEKNYWLKIQQNGSLTNRKTKRVPEKWQPTGLEVNSRKTFSISRLPFCTRLYKLSHGPSISNVSRADAPRTTVCFVRGNRLTRDDHCRVDSKYERMCISLRTRILQ